jgi:hypothetical protein
MPSPDKKKEDLSAGRMVWELSFVPVMVGDRAGQEVGASPDEEGQGRRAPGQQCIAAPLRDLAEQVG